MKLVSTIKSLLAEREGQRAQTTGQIISSTKVMEDCTEMPVAMVDHITETRSLPQMTTEKYSEISLVEPTPTKKSPTDTGFHAQL